MSKLIAKDGHEINIGDEVTDFRGEKWIVTGWAEPKHSASTGRVYLENSEGYQGEYFPAVIDAHIEVNHNG